MRIKTVKIKLQLEQTMHDLSFVEKVEKKDTDNGCTYYFEKTNEPFIQASLCIQNHDDIWVFTTKVNINQSLFGESDLLETQSPVIISIEPTDIPEKICAQYQHKDWWSRPSFVSEYSQVPKRTQSLLVKYENTVGYFLPMAGDRTKAYIQGGADNALEIRLTAYTGGIHQLYEVCLLYAEGNELHRIIDYVWKKACEIKKLPDITKRDYPDMFEYIGWCSWDAVYTGVTEAKIREKANELKEKNIPIRWLLIDDGWLSVENGMLYSFEPDKTKFPNGFLKMITEIKKDSKIEHIGVWHAFGAYWGGVQPGKKLAEKYAKFLYQTKNNKLVPHYEPEKGFGFWRRWYEYLREQGISFVKVDGQSALKNYYRNNEEIGIVAKGSHQSLEAAAELYMQGNLINCMGMAIENILSRPTSGISRNSDDFVPTDENGFREHVLQNAYNALYHSRMVYCDWDMYWTNHIDAKRHGLLRAISGGPVYVSDKIGESIAEEMMPLVYHDGRILRADRCALPAMDCIFDSPLDNKNLVLTNMVNETGVAALFHIGETKEEQTTYLKSTDIYGLCGEKFIVYRWLTGDWSTQYKDEPITINLHKCGYEMVLFIQKRDAITPVGLTDKYMSYHSIKKIQEQKGVSIITLKDGGIFTFHADNTIAHIIINEVDWTEKLQKRKDLYHLDLSQIIGEVCVKIFYDMESD